jgi:SPP1 gp7 family putative phage head morphogenesis protein
MFDWDDFFNRETQMPDRYYASGHYEKLAAFSFANAASLEQVRHIQTQLTGVYRQGGTFRDFKRLARQGALALKLPNYRLENIFRTNIMTAYARGSYLEQAASAQTFPWGKYVAVMDSATRPAHARLNGVVVKVGSDEYNRIYPPNGYQCRCAMRALTERQAQRERRIGDKEQEAILKSSPPDPGFEGTPFYGEVPQEMLVPPEMTERQLMKFLDTGETATEEAYARFMADLEKAGRDATPEQAKRAQAVPGTVAAAKKAQMKIFLDKYIQKYKPDDYGRKKRYKGLTEQEKEVRRGFRQALADGLKEAGLIGEATEEAKDRAIAGMLRRVFEGINEAEKWTSMSVERWRETFRDFDQVDEVLKDRRHGDMFYSASLMRFLGPEERLMLAAYTSYGDQFVKWAIKGLKSGPDFDAAVDYVRFTDQLFRATDRFLERQPVTIYRGAVNDAEWVDRTDPAGKRTIADVLKGWRKGGKDTVSFDLPTSYSSSETVAKAFAYNEGANGAGNESVVFKVASNRAMPISSVSRAFPEDEHLMRAGEKFRIVDVKDLRGRKSAYDDPDFEVELEHIDPKAKVDYEFLL